MNMTISIELLFFIIPFAIAFMFSLKYSDINSGLGGSDRGWYWLFIGPLTLIISLASWAIYLRWFK